MGKHTPGPWELKLSDEGAFRIEASWDHHPSLCTKVVICDRQSLGYSPEVLAEANANAHLIAAAPELMNIVESLEWLRHDAVDFCHICGNHEDIGHTDDCRLAAALAKAKGETG